MRRAILPLMLALLLPTPALAQTLPGPDRDLENLVKQLDSRDVCWNSPVCTPEMRDNLSPADRNAVRAYQRDSSRLHAATLRALRRGSDLPYPLLSFLALANAVDASVLETVALCTTVAPQGESFMLVDFLVSQLVPHAPLRNNWLRTVLTGPPARRTDLHNQRELISKAFEQHALPEDLLAAVIQRYPDLLTRHAVSLDHPTLVPSLVQRIVSSPVSRADLLQALATQLRANPQVLPSLLELPPELRLRVMAYASDGSTAHLSLF